MAVVDVDHKTFGQFHADLLASCHRPRGNPAVEGKDAAIKVLKHTTNRSKYSTRVSQENISNFCHASECIPHCQWEGALPAEKVQRGVHSRRSTADVMGTTVVARRLHELAPGKSNPLYARACDHLAVRDRMTARVPTDGLWNRPRLARNGSGSPQNHLAMSFRLQTAVYTCVDSRSGRDLAFRVCAAEPDTGS